jgi:uncharacterized protein
MDRKTLDIIAARLKENGATSVLLVGSHARNESGPGSDIDLIVQFRERKSLLEIIRIERELSEELGTGIDLLTRKSINPLILESMEKDKVVVV